MDCHRAAVQLIIGPHAMMVMLTRGRKTWSVRWTRAARATAMVRVFAFISAAMLVCHLIGATHHNHDLKRISADCASCVLAAQLQPPPPDLPIKETLLSSAVFQYMLPALVIAGFVCGAVKPVPRAQGPPSAI